MNSQIYNVHYHRCKECGERMDHGCIDQSCAEGMRWVILCLRCYEHLLEQALDALDVAAL